MEAFKKKIKSRISALASIVITICGLLIYAHIEVYIRMPNRAFHIIYEQGLSSSFFMPDAFVPQYVRGIQIAGTIAILAAIIAQIARYSAALLRPAFLQKLYVSATDERLLMIRQKSAPFTLRIAFYCLLAATAITSSLGQNIIFNMLLATILLIGLISFSLHIYYKKKF